VQFDDELQDLERDLGAKKQEIVDTELELKKLEHDVAAAGKEMSGAAAGKEALEVQFTWILDEHQ
jgi:structural maintenance of chromosome 2